MGTNVITTEGEQSAWTCRGGDGEPHGWAQWKGTDLCMDLRCSCDGMTHVDGCFAYVVRCGDCGKRWVLDPVIRMREITCDTAMSEVVSS